MQTCSVPASHRISGLMLDPRACIPARPNSLWRSNTAIQRQFHNFSPCRQPHTTHCLNSARGVCMSFDIKHGQLPHSQISAHHRILPSVINATGKQLRPRTTHNSSTSYEQCVSPASPGSALPTRHPSRTPHRQRIQCLQQVESTCQRPDRVHNMSRHTGISSCDPAALNPRITSPKSRHVHAVDAHNILYLCNTSITCHRQASQQYTVALLQHLS